MIKLMNQEEQNKERLNCNFVPVECKRSRRVNNNNNFISLIVVVTLLLLLLVVKNSCGNIIPHLDEFNRPQTRLMLPPTNENKWLPSVENLINIGEEHSLSSALSDKFTFPQMQTAIKQNLYEPIFQLNQNPIAQAAQNQMNSIPRQQQQQLIIEQKDHSLANVIPLANSSVNWHNQSQNSVSPAIREIGSNPINQYENSPKLFRHNQQKQQQKPKNEQQQQRRVWHKTETPLDESGAAKGPPIYKSAPKHISELNEIGSEQNRHQHHKKPTNFVAEIEQPSGKRQSSDLHTAAGTKKKKKKVKVYHGYYYKEKKPQKKKKIIIIKKVYKKKKKIYKKNYYQPPKYHHHHHQPQHDYGKYYEYRSVPEKGAWKFGYKRGNKKHTIERKEHGHKSHFKTEVKWTDKKGKGHHVFDYNHHDQHKKHGHHSKDHHQAAGSSIQPPLMRATKMSAAHNPQTTAITLQQPTVTTGPNY